MWKKKEKIKEREKHARDTLHNFQYEIQVGDCFIKTTNVQIKKGVIGVTKHILLKLNANWNWSFKS